MKRTLSRLLTLGVGAILSVSILGAPQANAATGDKTLSISNHAADLQTNQCRAGSFQVVVTGFPDSPDDYSVWMWSNYGSCKVRARMTYLESDGRTVRRTPYYTASGSSDNAFARENVYRCNVEVGVRRADGTYYTRFLFPNTVPAHCPE